MVAVFKQLIQACLMHTKIRHGMSQRNAELKETRQAKDSQPLCLALPKESVLAANHLLTAFLKVGFVPIDCTVLCTQTVSRSGCSLRDGDMEVKSDPWSSRIRVSLVPAHPPVPTIVKQDRFVGDDQVIQKVWIIIHYHGHRQIEGQARKSIHRSGLGLGPMITQQEYSNKAMLRLSHETCL